MELSKRLQAVANLVSDGMRVADVGTDHGYIPIYLMKTGKSPSVIAMDINRGPLLRAQEHIALYNFQIETRLSDGVNQLNVGEVDCVVIAGMGGALTIKIMEEGQAVFRNLKEFVLQPQSEIFKVRQYLCENQYKVVQEDMILEDGKYYPMMKVINDCATAYDKIECRFGKLLLEQAHPILRQFLQKEWKKRQLILENLEKESGTHILARKEEIQDELEEITYALQRYYGND